MLDKARRSGKVDATDIEVIFEEGFKESHKKEFVIKYKPPFTDWLYHYIHRTLGRNFIVESQDQYLRDIGCDIKTEEVIEYATSHADLMIRKEGGGQPVVLAVVSVEIPKIKDTLTGMVEEMKLDKLSNVAIWECYRNMSATGAAISMEYLMQGLIVNEVTIYGIVVSINELEHAKVIKLMR